MTTDELAITGLDLSLTSTGVARILPGGKAWAARIQPGKRTGHDRLDYLAHEIADAIGTWRPLLAVVEGPSFGSAGRSAYAHEAAGLWWAVTHRLWRWGVPTAVVTPGGRAKYATGKGNASKDAVLLATARRYPGVEIDGNDQADALILAAMGADHLGRPLATVPAVHRSALAAVDWPEVTR